MQEAIRGFGEQLWSSEWQAVHNAYLKGRTQNTQLYKPGSQELLLLFSDRDGERVYQFPMYEQLEHVLEPILLQVVSLQAPQSPLHAERYNLLLTRVPLSLYSIDYSLSKFEGDFADFWQRGERKAYACTLGAVAAWQHDQGTQRSWRLHRQGE